MFETKNLDVPKGSEATEFLIDYEDPKLGEEYAQLESDLSDIHNIIHGKIKHLF